MIGMSGRGHGAKIVFDFDDAMGDRPASLRRMRAGLPDRRTDAGDPVDADNVLTGNPRPRKPVRQRMPVLRRRLPAHLPDQGSTRSSAVTGRDGPANQNRLCVKGRFGFDYMNNPQRLIKPMMRKEASASRRRRNSLNHFREATWQGA